MKERTIYITQSDKTRLQGLLDKPELRQEKTAMRDLINELQRAVIVPSNEIPADVVTMRSRVIITDRKSGERTVVTIVFPNEASLDDGKISVLAPIGTALIGYRVGDVISWNVPSGEIVFEISGIEYQPEAAGDYHL